MAIKHRAAVVKVAAQQFGLEHQQNGVETGRCHLKRVDAAKSLISHIKAGGQHEHCYLEEEKSTLEGSFLRLLMSQKKQ